MACSRLSGAQVKRSLNAVCGLVVAMAAPLVGADDRRTAPENGTIDDLKVSYLSCDRAANTGRLATAEIMHCSVIYEELKRRAFGNNAERLNGWIRSQPPAQGSPASRADAR